jgi:hypothetical protein
MPRPIPLGIVGDSAAGHVDAAQSILDQGGWCVLEVCTDVPRQHWEARVLIFDRVAEAVADADAEEIAYEPEYDVRLTGCDLRTLGPEPGLGAHLVYLADAPATPIRPPRPTSRRRTTMNVRDGMNRSSSRQDPNTRFAKLHGG